MASMTRRILSGATNGRPIGVVATTSPGTTIHAPGATTIDMVTVLAKNHATTARQLLLGWGGTSTQDEIIVTIPAQDGLYMIADNLPINGTTATIHAYATATNGLCILGYVDRIA